MVAQVVAVQANLVLEVQQAVLAQLVKVMTVRQVLMLVVNLLVAVAVAVLVQ
jgi:hypothetical protein